MVQLLGKRYTLFVYLQSWLRVMHLRSRSINLGLFDAPELRVLHLDLDRVNLLRSIHIAFSDPLLRAGLLADDLFHVVQLRLLVLVVQVVVVVHEFGALAVDLRDHLVLLDDAFVLLRVGLDTIVRAI